MHMEDSIAPTCSELNSSDRYCSLYILALMFMPVRPMEKLRAMQKALQRRIHETCVAEVTESWPNFLLQYASHTVTVF